MKLFLSGKGSNTLDLMQEYGLLAPLFPATAAVLVRAPHSLAFLHKVLSDADARVGQGQQVSPAFLVAALLWPPMQQAERQLQEHDITSPKAYQQAAMQLLAQQCQYTAIPRRLSMAAREIWCLQKKLESCHPRQAGDLLEHACLRAAYDFLVLRQAAGEPLAAVTRRWAGVVRRMPAGTQPIEEALLPVEAESGARRRPPRRRYRGRRSGRPS